jgi:hypothetical protein
MRIGIDGANNAASAFAAQDRRLLRAPGMFMALTRRAVGYVCGALGRALLAKRQIRARIGCRAKPKARARIRHEGAYLMIDRACI